MILTKISVFLFMANSVDEKVLMEDDTEMIRKTSEELNKLGLDISLFTYHYFYENPTKENPEGLIERFRSNFNDIQHATFDKTELAIFYFYGHGGATIPDNESDFKYFWKINEQQDQKYSYVFGREIYDGIIQINKYCNTVLLFNTCSDNNIIDPIGRTKRFYDYLAHFFEEGIVSTLREEFKDKILFSNVEEIQVFKPIPNLYEYILKYFQIIDNQIFDYKNNFNSIAKKDSSVNYHKAQNGEKNLSLIYSFDYKPYPGLNEKYIIGPTIICKLLEMNSNYSLKAFVTILKEILIETTFQQMTSHKAQYNPLLDVIDINRKLAKQKYNNAKIILIK